MQIFPPDRRSIVIPLLLHHSFTAQILPVGVVMVVRMLTVRLVMVKKVM